MNTNSNTGVVIAVIVLLIVLVGGWFVTSHARPGMVAGDEMTMGTTTSNTMNNSQTSGASTMSTSTLGISAQTTMADGNAVTVANQAAGAKVMISALTVSKLTWVTVRDSSGKTLGAALFPMGTHTDVSVSLLRKTVAGQSYEVLLYFDNGQKSFNLKEETLVENPNGTVAGATFNAQ